MCCIAENSKGSGARSWPFSFTSFEKLAKNSEGHAETAFHTTVAEQGLALEVPLTEIPIAGGQSFPVLLLSDWMKLILRLASDKPFSFDSFV